MDWRSLKYIGRFITNRNKRPVDNYDLEDVAKEILAVKSNIGETGSIEIDFGGFDSKSYLVVKKIEDTSVVETDTFLFNASDGSDQDTLGALLSGIKVEVIEISPKRNFTVAAYAPEGTFGKYKFNYIKRSWQ